MEGTRASGEAPFKPQEGTCVRRRLVLDEEAQPQCLPNFLPDRVSPEHNAPAHARLLSQLKTNAIPPIVKRRLKHAGKNTKIKAGTEVPAA